MSKEPVAARLAALARKTDGVFRGSDAVERGVPRSSLTRLVAQGVLARERPDVYRVSVSRATSRQRLRAALLWIGDDAMATGASALSVRGLQGTRSVRPAIALPAHVKLRSTSVELHRVLDVESLAATHVEGLPCVSVEAALVHLAVAQGSVRAEVAFEEARRLRLTSIAAMRAYVDRFGGRGRRGFGVVRSILDELDPANAARSTLEVLVRRLLVAHDIVDFQREQPLTWNGRTYRYDFVFPRERVVLEVNGRRWHDDAADYEHDNEKWSVPGRLGYRLVFATWAMVTRRPGELLAQLQTALAA